MTDVVPAHSPLGPSGASRWMNCAGSVAASAGYADTTSEAAAEGTVAHWIAEMCSRMALSPFDFVGYTFTEDEYTFEWTEDDAELLLDGLDHFDELPGLKFPEMRVNLSAWLGEGQFGTLDRGIVSDEEIRIVDLKWGRGVPVSPIRNKQLLLYALAFYQDIARHHTKATRIVLEIDQPRCPGGGGVWATTLDELLAFGEEARAAAERTRDPNAPRTASADACLWCPAKNDCSTYDAFNLEMLSAEFEDLDDGDLSLPDPDALTPERRETVLKHRPMIEKWLKGLHAITLSDALAGRDAGGLKAVEGRKSPDKWGDSDSAEAVLKKLVGDKAFAPRKIITPTQAKKTISSEDVKALQPFITYGERKPSLVPVEDERPALLLADGFDDLPD